MANVQVRYIVHDVEAAVSFYCNHLGFREVMHPSPFFAMLSRDDLRLVLSKPGGGNGGGSAMANGKLPEPGGWNRFAIEVDNIDTMTSDLRKAGIQFRSEIITGVGGKHVIIDDPSGNPVELFQPSIPEARLAGHRDG